MFRNAVSASLRHAFLDALADTALEAQAEGRAIIGTSVAGGPSAQFESFRNWSPGNILELIDGARTWADEATVTAALELIGNPVTETHFECGLER